LALTPSDALCAARLACTTLCATLPAWAALCVTLPACRSAPASAPESVSPSVPCTGLAPTYIADVGPVLARRCFPCHHSGGEAAEDHDFSKLEVLRAQRVAVVANVVSHTMPPPGQPALDSAETALLLNWAACGARER
jgi:hypothetical protein